MLNYTIGNVINKIPNEDSKPMLSNVVTTCGLSTGKVVVPHVQMVIIWGILG